jgi:hypothetical protein
VSSNVNVYITSCVCCSLVLTTLNHSSSSLMAVLEDSNTVLRTSVTIPSHRTIHYSGEALDLYSHSLFAYTKIQHLVSRSCLPTVGISFGYNCRSVCTFVLITCLTDRCRILTSSHRRLDARLTQPRAREESVNKFTFCLQFFEEPDVETFKLCQELYVQTGLTFNNSTLSLNSVCVFSEQTVSFALLSINSLVFITQMGSVYSAVRTGSLNKAVCACATYRIN